MRLVFYSGHDETNNKALNSRLHQLVRSHDPLITFIPSTGHDSIEDFRDYKSQFKSYRWKRFLYFPVDGPLPPLLLKDIFESDVIHLGGGNTFYFLKTLKEAGLLSLLRDYVFQGGILTGLSAGAIMMTPSVQTAAFPSFDCDDNFVNLTKLSALNLVSFEFFPHYRSSTKYDSEILEYSQSLDWPIYACGDGGGIIVDGGNLAFYGRSYCFFQGKKILLSGKRFQISR